MANQSNSPRFEQTEYGFVDPEFKIPISDLINDRQVLEYLDRWQIDPISHPAPYPTPDTSLGIWLPKETISVYEEQPSDDVPIICLIRKAGEPMPGLFSQSWRAGQMPAPELRRVAKISRIALLDRAVERTFIGPGNFKEMFGYLEEYVPLSKVKVA